MKKILIIFFFIFSFLFLNFDLAFAIRPFNTEDSFTTPQNSAVVEAGIAMLSLRDNTGSNTFTTTLKYGITEQLDIGFDIPYLSNSAYHYSAGGLADSQIKLKYKFYEVENELGISGLLQYQLKTGDNSNDIASNQNDFTLMLIASHAMLDGFLHLNFGYTFDDEQAGQLMNDGIIYNIGYERPLNDRLIMIAELLTNISPAEDADICEFSTGLSYLHNEALSFDAGIGCGLNNNSSNTRATIGLTYNFNTVKGVFF